MNKIELDEECPSCHGTGLYIGMAEHDGYAIQCYTCNGTGKYHFVHQYENFEGRKEMHTVSMVLECNPGIGVGGSELNFGGISYESWESGYGFPRGTEMREFTCPAWWFQHADNNRKPDWDWCDDNLGWGGRFSDCKLFSKKNKCWERFDKENR